MNAKIIAAKAACERSRQEARAYQSRQRTLRKSAPPAIEEDLIPRYGIKPFLEF